MLKVVERHRDKMQTIRPTAMPNNPLKMLDNRGT